MSNVEDKALYDNSSPISKAITNGYSSDDLFGNDYNLYGYAVDSDKLALFTVRDFYFFDFYAGINNIYYRFQPLL